MVERKALNQELKAYVPKLREFLDHHQIEVVAWDLDNTLIDTSSSFNRGIDEAASQLAFGLPLSRLRGAGQKGVIRTLRAYTREVIAATRQEFKVRPAIMYHAVRNTGLRLGLSPNSPRLKQAKKEISKIYDNFHPQPFKGAKETVQAFLSTGVPQIITTHADENWTKIKMRYANFNPAMFNDILCMDISRAKADQWQSLLSQRKIVPSELLVVGDNLQADIRATRELGAKCVFVNRHSESHPDLEKDKNVWLVNHISELIPTLINSM